MGIHNTALIGASGQGGYFINNSLRLRSSANGFLSRTPAVAGNRKTWTYSLWMKRGIFATDTLLLDAGRPNTPWTVIAIATDGNYGAVQSLTFSTAAGVAPGVYASSYLRDPSAWYHVVVAVDTTQATNTNRTKIYINGVQQALGYQNWFSQNADTYVNSTTSHSIGAASNGGGSGNVDGYIAEVYLVDGQALTPSSFGQTDSLTGQWVPKAYLGTYGTNGFYLKFADTSDNTAATIGKDSSGNGNNWTPNNISKTAGVTYDFMRDSPTVGPLASNYAVLNPLIRQYNTSTDFTSDGNLKYTVGANGGVTGTITATIPMTSGKWYAEVYINAAVTAQWVGVSSNIVTAGSGPLAGGIRSPGYSYKVNTGNKCNNDNTGTAYAAASTTGDTIGIAMDADAGSITFYKNGTSLGVAYTGMTNTGGGWLFGSDSDPNGSFHWNFGQRPFSYTPPTGFVALNTQNLPTPTINNGASYMAATLYTGTGSALSVSNAVNGISFQPDWVWIKGRSVAYEQAIFDVVRGVRNVVRSNGTSAEVTETAGTSLTAFDSGGFSLGTNGTAASTNVNGSTFVAWQWDAGTTTVTNTSGTISSQVRVNPTPGFSVVTYTGTGANATIGHGLGATPKMIIVKNRSSVSQWMVAVDHSGFTWSSDYFQFDAAAKYTNGSSTIFRQAPTSTVFSVGTNSNINGSTNAMVAYCFAPVAGYSAFGSYTGNGSSDGVFVFLGLRARFLMIKRTDSTGGWVMLDTARDTYNEVDNYLYANSNATDAGSSNVLDINSNGFKIRNSWTDINANGGTYVYMAFAENPFKYSNAR